MNPFATIPLRAYLLAGGAAAVLALGGGAYLKIRHDQAQRDRAKIEAAQTQTKVEQVATKAVDTYHTETIVIRERADRAVQAVQSAPGGDAPIPPAVRDAWLAGLRPQAPAGSDNHHPAKPSGAL